MHNIISSSLFSFLSLSPTVLLLIGIILAIISNIYLLVRFYGSKKNIQEFNGLFCYDKKSNEFILVKNYPFLRAIYSFFMPAFNEYPALRKQWDKELLKNICNSFPSFVRKRRRRLKPALSFPPNIYTLLLLQEVTILPQMISPENLA